MACRLRTAATRRAPHHPRSTARVERLWSGLTECLAMPTAAEVKSQLTGPGGPFEVVVEDVRGRPMQVYKDRMKALRQICEIALGRGDQTFIVYGDRNVSFGEFLTTANSV